MPRALLYGVLSAAFAALPVTAHAQTPAPTRWIASGFVGADFGGLADGSSFDLGGQLGFLYRGVAGMEFVGDFAPGFHQAGSVPVDRPTVNAFMFNAIAATPFGRDWRVQPYVAGGFGAIELRSTAFTSSAVPGAQTYTSQSKTGGDVGAGVTAFLGNFGIRADVRYYRAFSEGVSGLDFWRASIGVAARWQSPLFGLGSRVKKERL
jgi:hypothetical protein